MSRGKRITFPQSRVMKSNYIGKIKGQNAKETFGLIISKYLENGRPDVVLVKGETVIVIGNSTFKGYLVVEKNNHTIHVPFKYLELKQL